MEKTRKPEKTSVAGVILVVLGVLLLIGAAGLSLYNKQDDKRAGESVTETLEQLVIDTPLTTETVGELVIPDYVLNMDMDMPTETISGFDYIGIIGMPTLDLLLPVIDKWSYPAMKQAPCCYYGSAYKDNLVLVAHNYEAHFGRIGELKRGDEVTFTDIDGNVFHYAVWGTEVLPATAVEDMLTDEWDLTLFTCTLDGRSRVTVRCEQIED